MGEFGPVECHRHGTQQATFVCRHIVASLADSRKVGFNTSETDPDDPRPHAWCDECEDVRRRERGWNDVSEDYAGVTLLCGACYDIARSLNTTG